MTLGADATQTADDARRCTQPAPGLECTPDVNCIRKLIAVKGYGHFIVYSRAARSRVVLAVHMRNVPVNSECSVFWNV